MSKIYRCALLLLLLAIAACQSTDPQVYAKAKIRENITNIELAFNLSDLSGIMENYHEQFRQEEDGYPLDKADMEARWLERLETYAELTFRAVEIELMGNYWAVVSCEMVFFDGEEQYIFYEPSAENGDISYFFKDLDGSWKICGRDFSEF
ncbi:MAG: nuclear transport factor 2 family protein [Candidatus Cloacimonadales bacterium]